MGDSVNALMDYTKVIELKPDYFDAYNNRGCLLVEEGDFEGSIRDFTLAIKLEPDYATACFNRGGESMKKFWLSFMMAAVLFMNGQKAPSLSLQEDQARLSQILNKTASYCERVKSIALFYVCIVNIKDKIYFYRSSRSVKKSPYGDLELMPSRILTLEEQGVTPIPMTTS